MRKLSQRAQALWLKGKCAVAAAHSKPKGVIVSPDLFRALDEEKSLAGNKKSTPTSMQPSISISGGSIPQNAPSENMRPSPESACATEVSYYYPLPTTVFSQPSPGIVSLELAPLKEKLETVRELEERLSFLKSCVSKSNGSAIIHDVGIYLQERGSAAPGANQLACYGQESRASPNPAYRDERLMEASFKRLEAYSCHQAAGWPSAKDYTPPSGTTGRILNSRNESGNGLSRGSSTGISSRVNNSEALIHAPNENTDASIQSNLNYEKAQNHCSKVIPSTRSNLYQGISNNCADTMNITYCIEQGVDSNNECSQGLFKRITVKPGDFEVIDSFKGSIAKEVHAIVCRQPFYAPPSKLRFFNGRLQGRCQNEK